MNTSNQRYEALEITHGTPTECDDNANFFSMV